MERIARLPRIKRLTGLERLPTIGGKAKRREKPRLPTMTRQDGQQKRDDTEAWIAYVYQDDRLAARVRKLQDEYPNGTIPELVVLDWLRWHNISFEYQAALYGGRAVAGGLVPDFLLLGSYQGKVLQVQGDYWHGNASKAAEDVASKLKLIGSIWNGIKITSVTNIWEMALRDPMKRERALQMALVGMELPA